MKMLRWLALPLALLLLASVLPALTVGAEEPPLKEVKVCIDPGHGGSDPGAINETYSLKESEINLDVANALKGLLVAGGAEVVMTRTDDTYLTNADRYDFCNAQGATILVSVHTNSSTDPDMDGTLTLYMKKEDVPLARALQDAMYPALRDTAPDPASFRDFGLDRFASGVLLKSDMPAAMLEPLFMSNAAEARLLAQTIADGCEDYSCRRGQIATSAYQGILEYFATTAPAPTPTPTPTPAPTSTVQPEPDGTMHVAGVTMWHEQKGPNYFIYAQADIADAGGAPVPGASVSIEITGPVGVTMASGITGDDGRITLSMRTRQSGTYTAQVTDVVKDGWTYDPSANGTDSYTLEVQ